MQNRRRFRRQYERPSSPSLRSSAPDSAAGPFESTTDGAAVGAGAAATAAGAAAGSRKSSGARSSASGWRRTSGNSSVGLEVYKPGFKMPTWAEPLITNDSDELSAAKTGVGAAAVIGAGGAAVVAAKHKGNPPKATVRPPSTKAASKPAYGVGSGASASARSATTTGAGTARTASRPKESASTVAAASAFAVAPETTSRIHRQEVATKRAAPLVENRRNTRDAHASAGDGSVRTFRRESEEPAERTMLSTREWSAAALPGGNLSVRGPRGEAPPLVSDGTVILEEETATEAVTGVGTIMSITAAIGRHLPAFKTSSAPTGGMSQPMLDDDFAGLEFDGEEEEVGDVDDTVADDGDAGQTPFHQAGPGEQGPASTVAASGSKAAGEGHSPVPPGGPQEAYQSARSRRGDGSGRLSSQRRPFVSASYPWKSYNASNPPG